MSVTSGGRPAVQTVLTDPSPELGLEPPALAYLEQLASGLQRRAAPIRFGLATTAQQRDAIYRLRYQVVVERHWAPAESMPNGRERDEDDECAEFIVGWDDDKLIACARMIFPAAGRRLPIERIFDLTVEPAGQVVSVDRLIVARSHSGADHRILTGLVAACWREGTRRGYRVAAGIDSRAMIRLYRLVGIEAKILGPPRRHWNEERFPVRIDVAATLPSLRARWRALIQPSEGLAIEQGVHSL